MGTGQLNGVIRHLHRVALLHDGDAKTDGQLLECFVSRRDEAAFEALVRRHGAMVLGVCRRVLRHTHDAEDAFQATFLVLARKAASLRQRELVGNWLYGTAYRAALEARAARRRTRERRVSEMPEPEVLDEADEWRELRPVLDAELNRLPDKYRVPVVLCDLEGQTRRAAARLLGIPEGTLSGRLTTARRTLARRLARHGLAPSGGALALALSHGAASACPPASLVMSTIKAALGVAAGGAVASVVSAEVAALSEGVLKTMLLKKLQIATAVLLLAGLTAFGVGSLAGPRAAAQQSEKKREDRPKKPAEGSKTWGLRATLNGHKDKVCCLAFSRNGKVLATASDDGTAKLWDAASGKLLLTLEGHEGAVNGIAFAPDGKTVATAGEDKTVRLWDAVKGTELQKMAHTDSVSSVAFTPDGKTLVAGGGDNDPNNVREGSRGELHLWDPATGKEQTTAISAHNNRVAHLAFSRDGKTLVTGGHDNAFKVWDWDGKDQLKERLSVTVGESQGVYGLALAPDGKTVAVTCDGTIKLYDVATGKQRDELEKSEYRDGWIWYGVAFSPDSKFLAAESTIQESDGKFIVQRRGDVRIWEASTGKVRETLRVDQPTNSLAFSPDGETLVVGCRGTFKLESGEFIKGGDPSEETKDGPVKLFERKKDSAEKK